jgi:hypothetical protein
MALSGEDANAEQVAHRIRKADGLIADFVSTTDDLVFAAAVHDPHVPILYTGAPNSARSEANPSNVGG